MCNCENADWFRVLTGALRYCYHASAASRACIELYCMLFQGVCVVGSYVGDGRMAEPDKGDGG